MFPPPTSRSIMFTAIRKGCGRKKRKNKIAHQTIHMGGRSCFLRDFAADEKTVNRNGKANIGKIKKKK